MEPDKKPTDGTLETPVEEFSWELERETTYVERKDFVILKNFGEVGRSVKYFVKGLTGEQRAIVEAAGQYSPAQVQGFFEKMLRAIGKDENSIAPAFQILFGVQSQEDNELPPEYVKMMKIFQFGSVDLPDDETGWTDTLLFFTRHYFDAVAIVAKINELSALGWEAKKKPT